MKLLTDATLPGARPGHASSASFFSLLHTPVTVASAAVTQQPLATATRRAARGRLLGDERVTTVRPIWALRLYAARKERRVSRITPLTVQVSEAHSEARRRVYGLCMKDGRIDADEQPVLDAMDEAGRMFCVVDLARRTGDWIRDTGRLPEALNISPFLQREWRELGTEPQDAA